jgi:hypothetical protein
MIIIDEKRMNPFMVQKRELEVSRKMELEECLIILSS